MCFTKVENDGFDLGAQRREIEKNDLPVVQEELCRYLEQSRAGETVNVLNSDSTARADNQDVEYASDSSRSSLGLVVEKEKITADGEYNLGGERYRETGIIESAFPYVPLNTVATVFAGNPAPQGSEYFENGEFPFIRTSDVGGSSSFRQVLWRCRQSKS